MPYKLSLLRKILWSTASKAFGKSMNKPTVMYNFLIERIRGHSKSTFVEEGRGKGSLKSEQKRTEAGGPSMCVRSLF